MLDHLPESPCDRRVGCLQLEVVVERWVELESLLEGWDLQARSPKRVAAVFDELVPGVQLLELVEGPLGEQTPSVGRPIERRIMKTNEVSVPRPMQIGLDVPIPELGRPAKRGKRILRPTFGSASVCEGNRDGGAELRACHRDEHSAVFASCVPDLSEPRFVVIVAR